MLKFQKGNIFDDKSYILVNPVNCVGVMGAGLAKQFKEKFPDYYKWYRFYCQLNTPIPGVCFPPYIDKATQKNIISLPTKDHYSNYSKYEWVDAGLLDLANKIKQEYLYATVAVPMVGCGLGGLRQEDVLKLMYQHLEPQGATYNVYVN